MSTTYHQLREPFTSIRLKIEGGHTAIDFWVDHANSGFLVVRNDDLPSVLRALSTQDEDDQECAVIRRNGQLRVNKRIEPATCLVSEDGELTSLALLRKEHDARV